MKLTTATFPAVIRSVLTERPLESLNTKLGEKTPLTNSSPRLGASWPPARPGATASPASSATARSARRHIGARAPVAGRAARRPRPERLAVEVHDVGAPDRVEVGGELRHQLSVFPGIGLEPVVAWLVPLGEERVR